MCCRGSQKYNHEWGLQQLREVWTKNLTGDGVGLGEPSPDEDEFEKQMRLSYESQVRVSTVQRYGKSQVLDQLEEWMKKKPIPYISIDKFSQEDIFDYRAGRLPGHAHVNQTYPDVVRMWRQFHGCPASGGGIERVFFSAGKQHDALKKRTMNKTLESTLKASINTTLPTCDDKGVFTDDDTNRKRK